MGGPQAGTGEGWAAPDAGAPLQAFVAVDCETTGLDPERDALIQLAAVRVAPDGVSEWWTPVAPGRPIPLHVRRLTGIGDDAVANAPPPADALAAFSAFAAGLPLVAHHAPFDASFLRAGMRRGGVGPLPGPVYDTLELSRLVDPLAPSHRLADLAARHGVALAQAHDALHDARATAALASVLLGRLVRLDPALRRTLAHLLARGAGEQAALLRALLGAAGPPAVLYRALPPPAERERPRPSASTTGEGAPGPPDPDLFVPEGGPLTSPTAAGLSGGGAGDAHGVGALAAAAANITATVGALALERLLRAGSPLAAAVGGFEARPGQAQMLAAVWRAFASDRHLVVEAGTGTGKSLAYLLPALAWAASSGERVLVSTHTLNLQEQLLEKDIPAIAASGAAPGRVALLKGRGQYACLRLWEESLAGEHDPDEAPFLARFASWLAVTETGDRGELGLHGEDEERFGALSADAVACTARRCPFYEPCFLFRARRRAEAADVVVVNHALLCADLRAERSVLPECARVVCDEAHHLEDEASQHLGRVVGERALERYFRLLERSVAAPGRPARPAGLLPLLRARFDPLGLLPGAEGQRASRVAQRLADAGSTLRAAREGASTGCAALRAWVAARQGAAGLDRWAVRLPAEPPTADVLWRTALVEGERLVLGLRGLAAGLEGVAAAMDDGSPEAAGDEGRVAELRTLAGQAGELAEAVELCLGGREGWVAWAEVAATRAGDAGAVVLRACPVDPAEPLQRLLFRARRSVVLTSATLSVRGQCGFLRGRLGLDRGEEAERTDELLVGSPFDYRRQALLAVPADAPRLESQRAAEGVRAVTPMLLELLRASRGHALILFTANRLLREMRAALKPALEAEGIACLAQGVDGSRTALTQALRRNEETVVLGAASFWEGVDVRGEGLRLVVIAQLPFSPPDQPLQQARQEAVAQRGGHPFGDLQLPQAVLRFKQGFGRLVRATTDRGAVVVLDPRVATASYGRAFLQSLPAPEVLVAPSADVVDRVRDWLEVAGGAEGAAG